MKTRRLGTGLLGAALALAVLPSGAIADTMDAASAGKLPDSVAINSIWVLVAGLLVIWMQAGFALLEIGFSRGKNAGTVVAKILTNFSIAGICYWACGFAFAFGAGLADLHGAQALAPRWSCLSTWTNRTCGIFDTATTT